MKIGDSVQYLQYILRVDKNWQMGHSGTNEAKMQATYTVLSV